MPESRGRRPKKPNPQNSENIQKNTPTKKQETNNEKPVSKRWRVLNTWKDVWAILGPSIFPEHHGYFRVSVSLWPVSRRAFPPFKGPLCLVFRRYRVARYALKAEARRQFAPNFAKIVDGNEGLADCIRQSIRCRFATNHHFDFCRVRCIMESDIEVFASRESPRQVYLGQVSK
jgi:hypothetical protein